MTGGEALEEFVRSRWGRRQGGIRGLASKLNVSADTIYRWFQGDPIGTDTLQDLADALGVRRYEIVAVMDGEEAVLPLNETTRTAFVQLMDQWAEERGLLEPRPGHSRESGAA